MDATKQFINSSALDYAIDNEEVEKIANKAKDTGDFYRLLEQYISTRSET